MYLHGRVDGLGDGDEGCGDGGVDLDLVVVHGDGGGHGGEPELVAVVVHVGDGGHAGEEVQAQVRPRQVHRLHRPSVAQREAPAQVDAARLAHL